MKDIVEKSFYITGLFADIKSDTKWTEYEIKTVLMLFSKLSEYRIYIPDYYKDKKNKILDKDKIYESISKVPREYIFSREDFRRSTSVHRSHLSREINKVRRSLVKKTINTPHPIDIDDVDSGETIAWFSKITYQNSTGEILIKVNEDAIDRLAAFVKYTKIDFSRIVAIRNANSIYYYLFFKIITDSSSDRDIMISLQEFKEKINLSDKYVKLSHFKEKVLNVIINDINNETDLNISYELIKEGRAYTKIKFNFDYKQEYIQQNKGKTNYENKSEFINIDLDSIKSPFEQIFKGWGIGRNKIKEIESNYTLSAISNAIKVTKDAIEKDSIKKSPASFFLGTLDNKQLQEEVAFKQVQEDLRKEQEKSERKALASEYDAIQKFINDNDEELSRYLSAKSLGTEYPLNKSLKEEIANISCVDADKYKDFRPKLAVLERGYIDYNTNKLVRPNMYNFLLSIYNAVN